MIRAFVALPLPESLCERLAIVAGTLPLRRVVAPENMHLTLAFMGEQPEPVIEEVHMALSRLRAPAFSITLAGLGTFGGPRPRNIHVCVVNEPGLDHLQRKVGDAVRGAGIEMPARRFVPHVTLARPGSGRLDMPRLERALAAAMHFTAGPVEMREFALFRAHLGARRADYEILASYALEDAR